MHSSLTAQLSIVILVLTCCGSAAAQSSQVPTADAMWGTKSSSGYQILSRPPTLLGHHDDVHTNRPQTPSLELRAVKPYAYGWFGTQASPHFSRRFGYSKNYTNWTLK